MGNWENNDRERGKPNWLTEEQRRNCIRTDRGWEIPIPGGTPLSATSDNHVEYEVIVAMSVSDTDRASDPSTNDAPYFTFPLTGDGPTQGGSVSGGVDGGLSYGATAFGVSFGATAYIPLFVADADSTDVYSSMAISGPFVDGNFQGTGNEWSLLTPAREITGNQNSWLGFGLGQTAEGGWASGPTSWMVSGILGGITDGAAILQISATAATGHYSVVAYCYDAAEVTGEVTFKVSVGFTGNPGPDIGYLPRSNY